MSDKNTISLVNIPLGKPIPDISHSVSVSIPDWNQCWQYMEQNEDIWKHITAGYPRFYVNPILRKLMDKMIEKHSINDNESCYIYPTMEIALDCKEFILSHYDQNEINNPVIRITNDNEIYCVFHPLEIEVTAKQYWAKIGQAISSRQAECFMNGVTKDNSSSSNVKDILRDRIAEIYGHSTTNNDVYLYPTGMASVYNSFKIIQKLRDGIPVCFGFPFVDTLRILRDFREDESNEYVIFLGLGDEDSLVNLENELINGLKISCLYCEFPSNPLLKSPNLRKIKELGDKYNFIIVVDDTIGNPFNIDVLEYCDLVISSLTKLFSGGADVMGGMIILNPKSKKYFEFKHEIDLSYQDVLFIEDAKVLERNSRNFGQRNEIINKNTETIVKFLQGCELISDIYYPSISESVDNYDFFKKSNGGGYGGLFSIVFKDKNNAIKFYNNIKYAKGPSLGTNFTLMCPFVMLAHFNELDKVETKWGVKKDLIRISIGMEDINELLNEFNRVLKTL